MLCNIFGARISFFLPHLNKDNTITTWIKVDEPPLFEQDAEKKKKNQIKELEKKIENAIMASITQFVYKR